MPTEENVTRKLRAILSADVKGYSLLMSDDEAFTVKTLKSYRKVMSAQIVRHKGRVVDAPGDNLLAEFASVVDAVQCSVEIQKILKERNEALTKDKRLEFRIGVNIGDVIQDGGNLYGEGVNIAARIEALAEPGGVCISRNAYDHVRNKLNYGYEYLGEHSVKNIKNPVRVYKLLMADEDAGKLIGDVKPVTKKWVWATAVLALIVITSVVWQVYQKMTEPEFEPALVEEMAFPLPEKPSIAVLPFDNMSGDPQQDNFSDGISEEIISALSKTEQLFVIARNSTFTYKGKPVKIKQVAEELGVRYVLEGSVRKAEGRVRITAQLIDATTGYHLWSERYDHDLKDIFALQDEITMKIVTALQIELTEGEQARMMASGNKSLDIHLKSMELASLFRQGTIEGMMRHGQTAREVIDMAPELPVGYRTLGWHHWWLAGSGKSPKENMKKALELAQKAISLNESESLSHALLGAIYLAYRQYEKAIAAGERSVELDPNGAQVHLLLGQSLNYAGRPEEAIVTIKKGIRLNPYPSFIYYRDLGLAYNQMGQYEKALIEFKKAQQLVPESYFVFHDLAITYSLLDRQEEARALATKCQELAPFISASWFSKRSRYKNQEHTKRIIDAMRKAGFPEYPPGKKLPEKPSIAVLPFDNLSDDPEQGYLADGLTDELIGDLAKIEGIFVISRNSAFTYKGKSVKIQDVAKELNVRYVLEGSVQRAGDRLRIRAQLIDGKTDHHVWSESYDGAMDDIFELQDEITGKIVAELAVKLTEDEKTGVTIKGTDILAAYEEYLKGLTQFRRWTPDSFAMAVQHFEKATQEDPNYSDAYAMLGYTYVYASQFGGIKYMKALDKDPFTARVLARHYLELALKKPNFRAYSGLALMELMMRRFESAKEYAKQAVLLSPNDPDTLRDMGQVLLMSGDPEAIQYFKKSSEVDPLNPVSAGIAFVLAKNGQYEEALKWTEKSLSDNPYMGWCSAFSAISYAYLANKIKATEALENLFSTSSNIKTFQIVQRQYYLWPFKNKEDFEWLIEGLQLAGLQLSGDKNYYRVEKENRLTGTEIKSLCFGHTYEYDYFGSDRVKTHINEGGEADFLFVKYGRKGKGKAWIEGDSLCHQFDNTFGGIKYCTDIYKNQGGDKFHLNEYLRASDFWIFPFAIIE